MRSWRLDESPGRSYLDESKNVVTHLEAADGGEVTLTLEVQASADGFDDRVERTVKENAVQLRFTSSEFEE